MTEDQIAKECEEQFQSTGISIYTFTPSYSKIFPNRISLSYAIKSANPGDQVWQRRAIICAPGKTIWVMMHEEPLVKPTTINLGPGRVTINGKVYQCDAFTITCTPVPPDSGVPSHPHYIPTPL